MDQSSEKDQIQTKYRPNTDQMTKSTFSVFPQALHCHFVFFRAFVGDISAQYDVNDIPFADEHDEHEEALKHVQHVKEVPV